MDAISPEYRLEPDGEGAPCVPGEWRMAEQQPMMFHRQTRLVFEIYRDPAANAPRPGIMELRARLNHVCAGHRVPSANLARLGCSAIYAYSIMTEAHEFIEHDFSEDDIPF
jgi:hypothetical protein